MRSSRNTLGSLALSLAMVTGLAVALPTAYSSTGVGAGAPTEATPIPGLSDISVPSIDLGAFSELTAATVATLKVRHVPTLVGSAKVGSTLKVRSRGMYSPSPTSFTYQWYRAGERIPGATRTSYTLRPADYKQLLRLRVTAHRAGHKATSALSRSYPVAVGTTVKLKQRTPKPAGAVRAGSKLTATAPATYVKATRYSYQWRLDGKAVKGATAKTYLLPRSATGKTVSVSVRVSSTGYRASAWSTSYRYRIAKAANSGSTGNGNDYVPSSGSTPPDGVPAWAYDPVKYADVYRHDSRCYATFEEPTCVHKVAQYPSDAEVAAELFRMVNEAHQAVVGNALPRYDEAERLAVNLSKQMSAAGTIWHDAGTGGQNVAMSSGAGMRFTNARGVAADFMRQWMNSPGHRYCIESPRALAMGVGIAHAANGDYFATLNTTSDPYWNLDYDYS